MDRWIGTFARGMLWLLRHPQDICDNVLVAMRFAWKIKVRNQQLVAVVHPVGLGNMICLLASMPALRQRHPTAWLVLISPEGCGQIAATSGLVDAAGDCNGLLHKLIERSRAVCVYYRPLLPDEYRPRKPQIIHLAEEFSKALGVTADLSKVYFRIPKNVQRRIVRYLQRVNPDRRAVVVLHPGPTWAVRKWPTERWLELIKLINRNLSTVLIRIGINRPGLMPPVPPFPGVIDWTNRLNVTETIALLKQVDALVAVESGPLHVAGVLGLPAVGLFGPTIGQLFLHPRGRVNVVTSGMDCLGCHHAENGPIHWESGCPNDIECMKGISADSAFTALVKLPIFSESKRRYGRS